MAGIDIDPIVEEIITALEQNELSGDQLVALQENLAQLNYFDANPYPNMGPKTAQSVIDFLNDHKELTYRVSDATFKQINAHGLSSQVTELIRESAAYTPPEQLLPLYHQVNEIIGYTGTLQSEDIVQLKTNLTRIGLDCGDINGRMNSDTAASITQYLTHNPAAFEITSAKTLQTMIQNGQLDELQIFAQNNPDIVNDAIQKTLTEIDGYYESAPWQDIAALQTLLAVGGYGSGVNIDSNFGSQTRASINLFKEANPDAVIPEEKAPEVQAPLFDLGDEPGPYTITTTGTNGFGVQNIAIERAWAKITGDEVESNEQVRPSGRPLIIIDLGHGADLRGNDKIDQGAVSRFGLSETDFVDQIVPELAKSLHEQGFDVAFTRNPGEQLRIEGDYSKTLTSRPDFAHNLAEELGATNVTFLSLHANAATSTRNNGAEIYVQQNQLGEPTSQVSADLAYSIAGTYSIDFDTPTIVEEANFSVLRNFEEDVPREHAATYSASLVEFGYLSNPSDSGDMITMMLDPEQAVLQLTQGIARHIQHKDPSLELGGTDSDIQDPKQQDPTIYTPFTNASIGQAPAIHVQEHNSGNETPADNFENNSDKNDFDQYRP